MPNKNMNHDKYQRGLKGKSDAMLVFIISDAREAIAAMPDGENVGYYQDEIHYAHMELQRRNRHAAVGLYL